MSPQIAFLDALIRRVQSGDLTDVAKLRRICIALCDKAPVHDLVTIGETMVRIGEVATRAAVEQN